jgi:hypothetical protein
MQNRTALKRQMKDDMIAKRFAHTPEDVKAECRAVAAMLDANDAIGAKTRFTNFCVGRRIGLGERSMLADLVGLYQDSN